MYMNADGYKVQGTIENSETSGLEDIVVPLGEKRSAKSTNNAFFVGNFKADGDKATTGTRTQSVRFYTDALATVPADGSSNLATVYDQ